MSKSHLEKSRTVRHMKRKTSGPIAKQHVEIKQNRLVTCLNTAGIMFDTAAHLTEKIRLKKQITFGQNGSGNICLSALWNLVWSMRCVREDPAAAAAQISPPFSNILDAHPPSLPYMIIWAPWPLLNSADSFQKCGLHLFGAPGRRR